MSRTKQKADAANGAGVVHTLNVSVPEKWDVVPLGTVLEAIVGGGTPSRDYPSYWSGSIPWLTVKDMRTRRPEDSIDHISEQAVVDSATNIIPADTVIIATRIGLGKVIRVPFDAAINQDLKALITKPSVDKSYLEYWIYSIATYLESIGSGTTVKGIRLEQVRSLPFPLAPLDQQKLIVAEIEKQFSRLDEAVANLKRVKANLKRYKAAVLKAAVEGRLVETEAELARREGRSYETGGQLLQRILETRRSQWQGKGKYREPAAPDTTDLPELPEGWVWASLDQLTSKITSGSRDWSQYYGRGTGIFVLAQNVRPFTPDFSVQQFVDPPSSDSSCDRSRLQDGDLLATIVGANAGQVCLVGTAPRDAYVCQSVALIRPVLLGTGPHLNYWLNSAENGQRYLDQCMYGQGRPHLSFEQLMAAPIALPPLAEQYRIVAEVDRRFSLLRKTEAQVDANHQRAERLRQSTLNSVFSGDPA